MKVKDAIAQGYVINDKKLQRGYVSRKIAFYDRDVLTAQGRRKGQLYFLYPCHYSTRYCFRIYLTK